MHRSSKIMQQVHQQKGSRHLGCETSVCICVCIRISLDHCFWAACACILYDQQYIYCVLLYKCISSMHKYSKMMLQVQQQKGRGHQGCQTGVCICLCIRISLNHCFCANLLAFCMFSSIYSVFYCINVYPLCTKHKKICSKCSSNKVGTPWLPNRCLHMFVYQKPMEND